MSLSAAEIAETTGGTLFGPAGVRVEGAAPLSTAGSGDLAFVEDANGLRAALASAAGIVIAGPFAAGAVRE